jgi:hypothetical protein
MDFGAILVPDNHVQAWIVRPAIAAEFLGQASAVLNGVRRRIEIRSVRIGKRMFAAEVKIVSAHADPLAS